MDADRGRADDAAARAAGDGFERHRARLFGLAYRMLGSVADAEDTVQDAYLRWEAANTSAVANPEAYLSRVVTRLCLDQLRSARARRETYVGPWLPEPLVDEETPSASDAVEIAHDATVALMLALERLTPLERAAFLLHDVFDQPFDSIAETLGRSAASCRQLAVRARAHVRAAAPRSPVSKSDGARIVSAFAAAVQSGDLDRLKGLLAEQAVLYSDGGGRVAAALNPIHGRDRVARFYIGVVRKFGHIRQVDHPALVNGLPGLVSIDSTGQKQTTAFDIVDGKIRAIYAVRNPDKLDHVAMPAAPPSP